MENWAAFLQERWFVILIAIIVLIVVLKIVRTVVKWVLVLAIVAAVIFYGASYKDKLAELGTGIADQAKEQAIQALSAEAKDAKYSQNPDGTFTVTTKNITLEGKAGSDEVKISFKGHSVNVRVNDVIRAFIDQARNNNNA